MGYLLLGDSRTDVCRTWDDFVAGCCGRENTAAARQGAVRERRHRSPLLPSECRQLVEAATALALTTDFGRLAPLRGMGATLGLQFRIDFRVSGGRFIESMLPSPGRFRRILGPRTGYWREMGAAFYAVMVFAAEAADVGGRGDNPSDTTGVVTIVVIAALVLAAGLLLAFVFSRGRARRRSLERRPDGARRVGRVSQMRGD